MGGCKYLKAFLMPFVNSIPTLNPAFVVVIVSDVSRHNGDFCFVLFFFILSA